MKDIANSIIRLSLSRTARNTYFVTFGNGISAFLAFVFTVIVIRNITIEEFGYFSAFMSFILLSSDISDLGIGSSLARFLPPLENDKKSLFRFYKTSYALQISICLILFLAIIAAAPVLANLVFRRNDFAILVRLTSIGVVGSILSNFYLYTFLARQRFVIATIYMIFTGVLRLVLLFITMMNFPLTIHSLVFMQVISLVIGAVAGQLILGFEVFGARFNFVDFKKLVAFSSFLGVARSLTAIAGKLDVLLLVALANPTEAGIYATAAKIIAIYPLLSGSFSSVVAPRLSVIANKSELRAFIMKVIAGTSLFIATIVFLIIIADPFIRILFTEKSAASIPVFRLLLVSMIFFVGSVPSVSIAIYYLKKPWILTINSVIQVAIVSIGNFLIIPQIGRFAPAYVSIVAFGFTWALTSFLSLYYLKRHNG